MARVAVIVPVYNVENHIEACIESILNQSFDDFKLILINDGSTDLSGEICEEYKKSYERIELIHQENMGLSVARNTGLENSTERYVTFVDSDDYIHEDMLKILLDNLIENSADISVADFEKVYKGLRHKYEEKKNVIRVLSNYQAVEKIVEKNDTNMIIACGKIYRRSLFQGIRYPRGKYHEDEFVTYKLLYKAESIVTTTAKLYYYTQRDESITGDKYSLKRLEKLEGLREAVDFFRDKGEYDLELEAKYRYLFNIQIAYYRIKFELKSEKQVLKSLKRDYNNSYKSIKKNMNEFSLKKRLILRFFFYFSNIYCYIVRFFMSIYDCVFK